MSSALRRSIPSRYDLEISTLSLKFKNNERLVVLPGGPGLTSSYLEPFALMLSRELEQNFSMLDFVTPTNTNIKKKWDYPTLIEKVENCIKFEIHKKNTKLNLVAHSFGAIIAIDLYKKNAKLFNKLILIGMPCELVASKKYLQAIKKLNLENERNLKTKFKKALPFYFKNKMDKKIINMITKTYFPNYFKNIYDNFPIASSIYNNQTLTCKNRNILYIEGAQDIRVPDNNIKNLKNKIYNLNCLKIKNCGHFPMIERPKKLMKICASFLS